ncbi:MAG TPA: hypothetical protein VJ417_16525, partial [Candidatus Glassbacteria bacterium]|nr:hypothetical protein [Candidatus Glassbacteria bacterium]
MPSLTGLGQTPGQPTEEAWRAGEQAPSYDYWSMGGYQEIPEDYMNDPRLTAGEKWVVDRLPGISSAIGGGMFGAIGGGLTFGIPGAVVGGIAGAGAGLVFPNAVGDALKYFNDSFLGKALLKLDIGAEYLERTMGMVALLSE